MNETVFNNGAQPVATAAAPAPAPVIAQAPQYAPQQMFGTATPAGGPSVMAPVVPSAVGMAPTPGQNGQAVGGQSSSNVGGPDTSELLRAIAQLRAQNEQTANQYQQQLAMLQRQQAQQSAPPNALQAPTVDENGIPQVPQFDPSLTRFILVDGNGNLSEAPGAPPGTLAAYHKHQQAMRQFITSAPELLRNQAQTIQEMRQYLAGINQQSQEHQRIAQVQSALSEVEPWAVEKDNRGQPVEQMNYATGQVEYKLTARGNLYRQSLEEARSLGISEPNAKHRFAMNAVNAKMPLQQAPARMSSIPSPTASMQMSVNGGTQVGSLSAMVSNGGQPAMTVAQQYPAPQGVQYGQPTIGPVDLNAYPRPNTMGPRPRLMDLMRENAAKHGMAI